MQRPDPMIAAKPGAEDVQAMHGSIAYICMMKGTSVSTPCTASTQALLKNISNLLADGKT